MSFYHFVSCDSGFGGSRCVPEQQLPKMLKDDFSQGPLSPSLWASAYGVTIGRMCESIMVAGNAAVFKQVNRGKNNLKMSQFKVSTGSPKFCHALIFQ